MSFSHGRQTAVLLDAFNLSAFLNEASTSSGLETSETTAFGQNAKTYIPALRDATVSLSGMFSAASTGALDPVMESILSSATDSVLTVAPQGLALGRRAVMCAVQETSYEISASVADVVAANVELQADGGLDSGLLLAAAQSVSTSTTTNGTNVDNTASTTNGGVAHLHVTENTRNGTTTFKVQHSVDNSTWVDLVSFAVVNGSTISQGQVVVAAGTTVNRHLRAQAVTAGSTGTVTYTIAFARR